MERLPDSAYEAVLRETPAARAMSPIVTTVAPLSSNSGSRSSRPWGHRELSDRDLVDHRRVPRAQQDAREGVRGVRRAVEVGQLLGAEGEGTVTLPQTDGDGEFPEVVLVERVRERHALR